MPFAGKHLLYGFHFTVLFSRKCRHYHEPFSCIIRVIDTEPSKNYIFPLMATWKYDLFNVHAQLPGRMTKPNKIVVLRVIDARQCQVFTKYIEAQWVITQRKRLVSNECVEVLCLPMSCDHGNCFLTLERLGSKMPTSYACWDFSDLYKHNNIFMTWVRSMSLSIHEKDVFFDGPVRVPFYVLLYMDRMLDRNGMEGDDWRNDACDVMRIISFVNQKTPFTKFIIWLDLMMCNIRCSYTPDLQYPQCNENRRMVDVVGCRMTLIDFLYSSRDKMFSHLLNSRWPVVAVLRDFDSSKRYVTCGLAIKRFLAKLVINNHNVCGEDDILLASGFPFNEKENTNIYILEMMCWRDYDEGILVCSVLIGECVMMFTNSSGDIFCSNSRLDIGINVWTDCQVRDIMHIPMIINSPKTLMPILNTIDALNMLMGNNIEINSKTGKLHIPWHMGWVDRFTGEWDRSYSQFKPLLDVPNGFSCTVTNHK